MVSLKNSSSSGEYHSFTESGRKSKKEETQPLHAQYYTARVDYNFASKLTAVVTVASYTLNRLDTSANGIYAVKKPSRRHRTLALRARVLWLPLGFLYRVDPLASVSNLYVGYYVDFDIVTFRQL